MGCITMECKIQEKNDEPIDNICHYMLLDDDVFKYSLYIYNDSGFDAIGSIKPG